MKLVIGYVVLLTSLLVALQFQPFLPKFVVALLTLPALAYLLYNTLQLCWKEAQPNQWMLVIKNGKLHSSGVGIKGYFPPWYTVVTFPSKIQKVNFTANNITKQYQGVEVKGFGIYSVYREEEGPFKYYRYMQVGTTDSHISSLCQCIVRHNISISSIDQVLFERAKMKSSIEKQLKRQLTGWGIWLETVEVTSVQICSRTTFTDKQAQTRMQAHQKAEITCIQNQYETKKNQIQSQIKVKKSTILNETKRITANLDEQIKRKTAQFNSYKKTLAIKKQGLKKNQELRETELDKQDKIRMEQFQDQKRRSQIELQFQINSIRNRLQTQKKQMQSINMEKYELETLQRIYNQLKLKDVRFKQYIGPKELQGGMAQLLPVIGMLKQEISA